MDQSGPHLTMGPPPSWPPPSLQAHGQSHIKRVPVVPSMLWTYAHMKGRNKNYFDPLHHALYPASDRVLFAHRMWLPPIAKRAPLEGLHKGATFFWDPVKCALLQPAPQLPPALHGGSYQPRRDRGSELTYEEYIRLNPPSIGTNHYKGEMVYANFGYYLAEGKWVDPESEGELFQAYINPSVSSGVEPILPDIHRSRDTGPRVMSLEEEDEFYKYFVADVSDEKDGEGDPRAWRITPATFAQWATGAVAGDQYEETVIQTPAKLPTTRRNPAEAETVLPKFKHELQFDLETGSLLSGIYEPERSPVLLQSPLGVDIIRPPAHLNYSYPQVMQELERHGFGAAWCDRQQRGTFPQTVASTPEVFSSENARKSLAHRDGHVISYSDFECAKEAIFKLREDGERGWERNLVQMHRVQNLAEKRIDLSREVFFLKLHLEQAAEAVSPNLVMGIPANLKDTPRAPSPPTPTPKRRQYQRFMNEAKEHENLQIARTTLIRARLDSEYQEIMGDIGDTQKEKTQLLKKLGIKSVDEIPGLMPRKKLPCENLRAEFHCQ